MPVLSPCTWQMAPFIMSAVTEFYYFGPQQPLFSLGVFADHYWSVCVPFPIARQKKTILFVCLPWHPFLLWSECFLSPYLSWHALSGSNSALLLLGGMSSQQDTFPKIARAGTSNIGLSPLPTAKPCPLTSDPWPHRVLYWLGTDCWGLGLACTFLPCISKIYLLLMHLPWLACIVCRPFFTIF